MKPLEKFKANSPPKRRVPQLLSIKDEVLDLYNSGYQVEQIQEFAKSQNINVSLSTVKRFLNKLKASSKLSFTNSSAKPIEKSQGSGVKPPNPFLEKIKQQAQE